MRGARLAVLALLAPALAGCLAPPAPDPGPPPAPSRDALTEPVLGFGPFLALGVPSDDGVRLHVDVQLPEGPGPFPVLLRFTPYAAQGDNLWGAANGTAPGAPRPVLRLNLSDYYVPRGYAVAVAHVRGTGESGGCLTVGGPEEGRDGLAVVEALAAEPWSTGKVAMLGTSYVGSTPFQTAVLRPPHLATIVPVAAVTEWYRYYFENGEQRVNGDPPPGTSYTDPPLWLALGALPGLRTQTTGGAEDVRCVLDYTREYWLQDDYNAFWQARNTRRDVANISVPVLYAHGLRDENTATSMLTEFWNAVPGVKRAWFAQHGHGVPSARADYHLHVHRWLDHLLLGRDNGALDMPPVVVEDNLGRWRGERDWPPSDARPLRLWLSADGALAAGPPGEGARAYRDAGSAHPAAEGVDHLRFVTAPLDAPLHLAGAPRVHLEAASDAPDTQFAVLLHDLAPDGTEAFVTRGYLDARHRDSLERGQDLVPGQRYSFAWDLHPRDHALRAGHRLAVVVASTDPYVVPDATRAQNTVFAGPGGSWLELPVIDPATRTFLDRAPVPE